MAIRDLDRIAEAVRAASGIHLKPHQYGSLQLALDRALAGDQRADLDDLFRSPSDLLDRLLDEVAVKETTFLRDRQQLELIDWHALLHGARERGNEEIVIWSAGCATGEEVYSLALLAHEAFPLQDPPVRIVGTDLSVTALEAARIGRYRPRALRDVEEPLRGRYFSNDSDGYLIDDRLRRLVSLQRNNLVTDPLPPPGIEPCSVIVCRNVFIYFEPQTVERILAAFKKALADDGIMIIGATDVLAGMTSHQVTVRASGRSLDASARRVDRQMTASDRESATQLNGPGQSLPVDERIVAALDAAGTGRRDVALKLADAVLKDNAFEPNAHFVRGLVELESGEPILAIASFRAALYADPTFGLAAFMLGRSHDACGESLEARRAYEQSLRMLQIEDRRHDYLLAQVDLGDVAAACRARLVSGF